MRTALCTPNTRLRAGHIAVLREIRKGRFTAAEESYLISTDETDCRCNPMKVNGHAPRVKPFLGQRRGHVERISMPPNGRVIRLKLIEIRQILPESD